MLIPLILPLILTPVLFDAAKKANEKKTEPTPASEPEAAPTAPEGITPVAPVPTPQQLTWQRYERTAFFHFGINTFTDQEWGDGTEDPKLFNPTKLNAAQWVQGVQAAGCRLAILTAKHHDGFCLWPSRFTEHSVKHSPWKRGQGDVVREFVDACRAAGLAVGLYLSPWDRHEPTYGDSPRYNEFFKRQLLELLTQYGPLDQLWFDGACAEGPNGKKQEYDWDGYYALIRKLQPDCLISICGPDIRWVGNESGLAREDETSVQERDGKPVWYPAECDVSIRPGWFWHAAENGQVRSAENLVQLYFQSVGRNSVLLLNVPPNRDGLLSDPDLDALHGFGRRISALFRFNLASQAHLTATSEQSAYPLRHLVDDDPETFWAATQSATLAELTADLGMAWEFDIVALAEPIALGERVRSYTVEAETESGWTTIAAGTVIGHKKLHRLENPIAAQNVRVTLRGDGTTLLLSHFGLYRSPEPTEPEPVAEPKRIATASASGNGHGPEDAIDSDLETFWAPETPRAWLALDLGVPQEIQTVTLAERGERIRLFAVEYLQADGTWKTLFAGAGIGSELIREVEPLTLQHLRLQILDADGDPAIHTLTVG